MGSRCVVPRDGKAGAAPATVSEVKDLQDATVPQHGKAQIQEYPAWMPTRQPGNQPLAVNTFVLRRAIRVENCHGLIRASSFRSPVAPHSSLTWFISRYKPSDPVVA